ncbi:MAG TPA: S41 family peptidase [Thermotogota bacterium]|nr:S41 family peptidase [Thermotogota bacterium]HRW91857.1 S41 family peptidase [Thermotogota bacterium]
MKKALKTTVVLFMVLFVLSFSWTLFGKNETVNVYQKLQPFFESLNFIEKEYYEKDTLDFDALIDASVRGVIAGLDDPFSYYLTPNDVEEAKIEQEGEYGGLGIEVTYDAQFKLIRVVAPMFGTPAYKAGVKAGDLILTIDASPVEDMTYMEAVNNLRGVPGTIVTLEVAREEVGVLEFVIERTLVHQAMVQNSFLETSGNKIGYVRINSFFRNTSEELAQAIKSLLGKGAQGFILDLRDNPGGYLTQAIMVASQFVDSGEVIVTTRSSDGFINTLLSIGNNNPDFPLVTLINGGSASSSEILAGALRDHNLTTLVGEKSFGKAAVQTLFPLSNGGELWLTTAHYLTPNGADIHMQGIEPDILVEPGEEIEEIALESDSTLYEIQIFPEKDLQLKTALQLLVDQL